MAVTLEHLQQCMIENDLKFHKKDDQTLITGFTTETYCDSNGEKRLIVAINLEEKGEYIQIYSPKVYTCKDGPHKLALFQLLLVLCWRTKLFQFEYDQADGEIRLIIEWPIEDGTVTRKQLNRCFTGMVQFVDRYHGCIQKAMDSGVIDLPVSTGETQLQSLMDQLQSLLEARNQGSTPAPETGSKLELGE